MQSIYPYDRRVDDKRLYEYSWKLLVRIPKGSLIDLETTGLNPNQDEIVAFGCIKGNYLKVVQRKCRNETYFLTLINQEFRELRQPFYAYNAKFERDFVKTKFGINARFVDLMEPWRKKADKTRIKWPKLGELISEPEEYFGEKIIRGEDIPKLWSKYLTSKDFKYLKPIIRHCQIDLLRELVLLIHYYRSYQHHGRFS